MIRIGSSDWLTRIFDHGFYIIFVFSCTFVFFVLFWRRIKFSIVLEFSQDDLFQFSAVLVNNGLNYRMFQIERFFLEKNKIPNIHSFRKLYLVYDNISRCHTLHFTNITIPKLTECAIFYLFSKNLAIWNKPLQYEYSIKIL